MASEHPLWFFWGQKHMTFLRYMTLRSACAVHSDVRLVTREEEVRPNLPWAEVQDFMVGRDNVRNWYREAMALPITRVPLGYIAPEIAALHADDVHTSDLLSWWLLATQGGTVCDMDIVFLKPLPLIVRDVEIVAHPNRPGLVPYVPIAYVQGRPAPKWRETYLKAMAAFDPKVYQSCGGENLRPWPDGRLDWFIIYPWFGSTFKHILNYCLLAPHWPPIPETCVGIHWYGGGMQAENQRIQSVEDLKAGALAWACREVLSREVIRA